MFRRFISICCLILVACVPPTAGFQEPPASTQPPAAVEVTFAPAATQAPAATEAPAKEEPNNPWNDPYEAPKPELCPEGTTPTDQPIFGGPTQATLDGQPVFIQRGLYANSQNEVFRIDVTGVSEPAVTTYTAALKVCLDYVTTGVTPPQPQEQPAPSSIPAPEPFGANPDDLIIELYAQGAFGPEIKLDETPAILKEIISSPTEDWPKLFESKLLMPPDAAKEFVIDLVLDPPVSNSATHQYVEKLATKIFVNVSVQYGAGSVRAGICRGYYSTSPITTMSVAKGGMETDSRSDAPGTGYTYRYDLGVKGNSSGTYRIGGRLFWPGWSRNYWDPAPTGSTKNCNP